MRRPPRILILLSAALCALFVWAASHRDQAGFAVQGERYGATGDHSPQVAPLLEPASKTLSQMPPRTATHRGRSMAMSVMAAQIKAAASGSGPCKTLVAIWIVRGHGTHLEVLTTPGGVGGAGVIDACVSRTAQLGAKAAEAAVDALLQESYGLRVRDTDFLSPVVRGAWPPGGSNAELFTFVGALAPARLRGLSTSVLSLCGAGCRFVDLKDAFDVAKDPLLKNAATIDEWVKVDDALVREYLVPFVLTIGKDPVQCLGSAAAAKAGGVNHVERWPVTRVTAGTQPVVA